MQCANTICAIPLNILVLGEHNSGKTALIHQFIHKKLPAQYRPTLLEESVHLMQCEDVTLQLHLSECSGDDFNSTTFIKYVTLADVILLVYSATEKSTAMRLGEYMERIFAIRSTHVKQIRQSLLTAKDKATNKSKSKKLKMRCKQEPETTIPIFIVGTHVEHSSQNCIMHLYDTSLTNLQLLPQKSSHLSANTSANNQSSLKSDDEGKREIRNEEVTCEKSEMWHMAERVAMECMRRAHLHHCTPEEKPKVDCLKGSTNTEIDNNTPLTNVQSTELTGINNDTLPDNANEYKKKLSSSLLPSPSLLSSLLPPPTLPVISTKTTTTTTTTTHSNTTIKSNNSHGDTLLHTASSEPISDHLPPLINTESEKNLPCGVSAHALMYELSCTNNFEVQLLFEAVMRVHLCVRSQKFFKFSLTRITAKELTCTFAKLYSCSYSDSSKLECVPETVRKLQSSENSGHKDVFSGLSPSACHGECAGNIAYTGNPPTSSSTSSTSFSLLSPIITSEEVKEKSVLLSFVHRVKQICKGQRKEKRNASSNSLPIYLPPLTSLFTPTLTVIVIPRQEKIQITNTNTNITSSASSYSLTIRQNMANTPDHPEPICDSNEPQIIFASPEFYLIDAVPEMPSAAQVNKPNEKATEQATTSSPSQRLQTNAQTRPMIQNGKEICLTSSKQNVASSRSLTKYASGQYMKSTASKHSQPMTSQTKNKNDYPEQHHHHHDCCGSKDQQFTSTTHTYCEPITPSSSMAPSQMSSFATYYTSNSSSSSSFESSSFSSSASSYETEVGSSASQGMTTADNHSVCHNDSVTSSFSRSSDAVVRTKEPSVVSNYTQGSVWTSHIIRERKPREPATHLPVSEQMEATSMETGKAEINMNEVNNNNNNNNDNKEFTLELQAHEKGKSSASDANEQKGNDVVNNSDKENKEVNKAQVAPQTVNKFTPTYKPFTKMTLTQNVLKSKTVLHKERTIANVPTPKKEMAHITPVQEECLTSVKVQSAKASSPQQSLERQAEHVSAIKQLNKPNESIITTTTSVGAAVTVKNAPTANANMRQNALKTVNKVTKKMSG